MNNIQSTTPKARIDDFVFGLSYINEIIQANTNNLNDYLNELRIYLNQKYGFLTNEHIDGLVGVVKMIMINKAQIHPIEKQEGLKAGVKY